MKLNLYFLFFVLLTSLVIANSSYLVETSSKKLELGESIASVQSKIYGTDLDILSDGIFQTGIVSVPYEQELAFHGNIKLLYEEDLDNDVVDTYLKINNKDNIANYALTFNQPAQSNIQNSELRNFIGKELTIQGEEYTISDATLVDKEVKLILIKNAMHDTIGLGEAKTYTYNSLNYVIEMVQFSVNSMQLKINGETTPLLGDDEFYQLVDNNVIFVSDIVSGPDTDVVQFYLGSQLIVFEDNDITANLFTDNLYINGNRMRDVFLDIQGTNDSSNFNLNGIILNYTADDDMWFKAGENLSNKLDEPEGLLNWDIIYNGLNPASSVGMVFINSDGDKQLKLMTFIEEGVVSLPLAYSEDENQVRLGNNADKLVLSRTQNIKKDQYFFLTTGTGIPGMNEKSYSFQYKGADSSSGDTTAEITLRNLASGTDITRTFTISSGIASFTLGGTEFTIHNTTDASAGTDDFDIRITGGADEGYLVTTENALIHIQDDETFDGNATNKENIIVNISEVDPINMLESDIKTTYTTTITSGDVNEIAFGLPSIDGPVTWITDPDDSDRYTSMTPYGAIALYGEITGQPNGFSLLWPGSQVTGNVEVKQIKAAIVLDAQPVWSQIPTQLILPGETISLDLTQYITYDQNVEFKLELVTGVNHQCNLNGNVLTINALSSFAGQNSCTVSAKNGTSNYVSTIININEKLESLNLITVPEMVLLGSSSQSRNIETSSQKFTITNNNGMDILIDSLTSNANSIYNVQFSTDNVAFTSNLSNVLLAQGTSLDLYVKAFVPLTQDTRSISIGKIVLSTSALTTQISLLMETKSNLAIETIKADSKTVSPGGETAEFKPGEKATIKFKLRNNNENKIEDIDTKVTVISIDDGDDLDQENAEFDLKSGKLSSYETFDFVIPYYAEEGTYTVVIEVEGIDENNVKHYVSEVIRLRVEKKKDEVLITHFQLANDELSCDRSTELRIEVTNTGSDDQEDVSVRVNSDQLDINYRNDGLELDANSLDDSAFRKTLIIDVPEDMKRGVYPIEAKVFYDRSDTESKVVNLVVEDCQFVQQTTQVTSQPIARNIVPTSNTIQTTTQQKESFENEDFLYMSLLILLNVLAIFGVFLFLFKLRK